MPFEPRVFSQIFSDMVAYVRTNSNLTDLNVGSVLRTMLEAAALEDDEQYYQMTQLLKEFSYRTASKSGLTRRAADFDLSPFQPTTSFGNVVILDDGLLRTYMTSGSILPGTIIIDVEDAAVFAALTPPVTMRLSEGQTEEEDVTVNTIDAVNNQLTLAVGVLNSHTGLGSTTFDDVTDEVDLDAARVSYVSGDPDITVKAGQLLAAPAVGDLAEIRFLSTSVGTITNGDLKSNQISVRANRAGLVGNIGPKRIISFPTTKPFSDAIVLNPNPTGGGLDSESRQKFVERITNRLGSLSRATRLALLSFLLDVALPETGQRIARLSILEEFVRDPSLPGDGLVKVYVDDGTGAFSPEIEVFGQGNLNAGVSIGAGSVTVNVTEGEFSSSGFLLLDPLGTPEIVEYSSYTGSPAVFTLVDATTLSHSATDLVYEVKQLIDESAVNRRFYKTEDIALVQESVSLYAVETIGGTTELRELVQYVPEVTELDAADFFIHEGLGDIEIFTDSVPITGSAVYVSYFHYTGLIERSQRTVDSDIRDQENFPGVISAGVKVLVLPANAVVVDLNMSLIIQEGYTIEEIVERADRVSRSYMTNLAPGESFIINELIERVMGIAGMVDLRLESPATNVVVDESTVIIPGSFNIT